MQGLSQLGPAQQAMWFESTPFRRPSRPQQGHGMTSAGSEHTGFQQHPAPQLPPAIRADEWQIIDTTTEFVIDLESPVDCRERLKRLGATPAHERAAIVTLVVFGWCALREGFLKSLSRR